MSHLASRSGSHEHRISGDAELDQHVETRAALANHSGTHAQALSRAQAPSRNQSIRSAHEFRPWNTEGVLTRLQGLHGELTDVPEITDIPENPESAESTKDSADGPVKNAGQARNRVRKQAAQPGQSSLGHGENQRSQPTFRERIAEGVKVPLLAGLVVFALAVVIAVVVTMTQSHVPQNSETAHALGSDSPATENVTVEAPEDAPVSVFVHVVGEVREPGVVELTSADRVEAAISAAGGTTEDAVLAGINLARLVTDGEQIVVPNVDTVSQAPASVGGTRESQPGAPININSADTTQLETLPRVGPALAARIIEWRESHGAFASIEDLLQISGIGAKTLEGFRDRVTV